MNSTKIINSSETHLPAIIEDTFDITLIESGDTKIWKQEVYLQPILGNIHQIIKSEQQKTGKGSTFYFTLPFDEQKAISIPVINEVEKVNNPIKKNNPDC